MCEGKGRNNRGRLSFRIRLGGVSLVPIVLFTLPLCCHRQAKWHGRIIKVAER